MTDTSPAAVAARVEHMRFCHNNHDADLIEALASQLAAMTAAREELASAIDSHMGSACMQPEPGHGDWVRLEDYATLKAENDRLRTNRDRFPELIAHIMAEKNLLLPDRIERLKSSLADLSPDIARYQWEADAKPAFGEKYIRHVAGNDGEGTGRQWMASTPPHIKGLAEYIAAANPDTVALLLAQLTAANTRADQADIILADNYDDPDSAADAILALRDKPAPAVTVQGELQESREYAQALEVELRDRTAKIERECKLAEAQVSRLLDMTNRMDDRLNALVSATEALGAMPEGYCFCSENRIGDDSKTHEPECEGLRSALRAIAGGGDE